MSATQTLAERAPHSERPRASTIREQPHSALPRHATPDRVKPQHAIETLLQRYESASPSVRRRGREWYPSMYRLLREMAIRHGRTAAQACAIAAITSANTQLLSNIRFTEAILGGKRSHGCYPKHQTPLIEAVLATRYPGRFVRGPKCTAFFAAIQGATDALVLDRWAARAAGVVLKPGRNDLGPSIRRELDTAYREAAKICGETTRSLQAIVWICVRESTPNRRGVIPQLFDITALKEAA